MTWDPLTHTVGGSLTAPYLTVRENPLELGFRLNNKGDKSVRPVALSPVISGRPPAWFPNAISAFRIVLVPVFWVVSMAWLGGDSFSDRLPSLAVLLAIGGSDLLDGYLARRYDLASHAGVILDAVADRFAQLAVTGFFVFVDPRLPFWFFGLLVARDLFIGIGTWVALKGDRRGSLRHELHGKAASSIIFVLFVVLVAGGPTYAERALLFGSTIAVLVSTAGYAMSGSEPLD